jgi:predicted aspartyl protease
MAQDRLISTNYPYISVRVDIRGWQEEASALLDTGFTGELIIPEGVLTQGLGFPDEHTTVEVGDNRIIDALIYLGTLEIVGFPSIPDVTVIVLGDEYILGREILDLFEVTFDHGQRVIVRP